MRWDAGASSASVRGPRALDRGSAVRVNRSPGSLRERRDAAGHRRRVPHDAVEGADAVLPPDLLAFVVGSAAVGDTDLEQAPVAGGDLGGDLGLDAEAALLEGEALEDLLAE